MNKNFTPPIGAALGTAIRSGYVDGFSHLDWYRVITVMLVNFVIELPLVYFARKKKKAANGLRRPARFVGENEISGFSQQHLRRATYLV